MRQGAFSVEILVDNEVLPEVFHPPTNKRFVEGPPGQTFVVRALNNTDAHTGVKMWLDGRYKGTISIAKSRKPKLLRSFSDGSSNYEQFVFKPPSERVGYIMVAFFPVVITETTNDGRISIISDISQIVNKENVKYSITAKSPLALLQIYYIDGPRMAKLKASISAFNFSSFGSSNMPAPPLANIPPTQTTNINNITINNNTNININNTVTTTNNSVTTPGGTRNPYIHPMHLGNPNTGAPVPAQTSATTSGVINLDSVAPSMGPMNKSSSFSGHPPGSSQGPTYANVLGFGVMGSSQEPITLSPSTPSSNATPPQIPPLSSGANNNNSASNAANMGATMASTMPPPRAPQNTRKVANPPVKEEQKTIIAIISGPSTIPETKYHFFINLMFSQLLIQHCLTHKIPFHGIQLQKLDGTLLPLDKTPVDLNVRDCLRLVAIPEDAKPTAYTTSASDNVVLKARYKTGATQKFKMVKTDPLAVLFDAFCKSQLLDPFKTSFSFDGSILHPSHTPAELGMEDDDLIDVK